MSAVIDVVLGGLLGDEGKGKLVGRIGEKYDAVLRVNASTNAGHCVSDGTNCFVTRQLPSVFYPSKTELVVAPGALFNLEAFYEELLERPDHNMLLGKVKVASSISLVIKPYLEKDRGHLGTALDSTRQGTGPSAAARAMRHSLHLFDIEEAAQHPHSYNSVLEKVYLTTKETLPLRDSSDMDTYCRDVLDNLIKAFKNVQNILGEFCIDYTSYATKNLLVNGKEILIEGCNGLLLDNLHGMHPYVTSASTNLGAMLSGANFSFGVRKVIIVIAAYATCLGRRPFPSEMDENTSLHFFTHCNEVDVAESKKRRIGWLDVPALRKALSGSKGCVLHMNRLDVLSGLKEIKICTAYTLDGKTIDVMPDSPYLHERLQPQYETVEGWNTSLNECRSFSELPPQAQKYIRRISKLLDFPIESVGVGPNNQQLVEVI